MGGRGAVVRERTRAVTRCGLGLTARLLTAWLASHRWRTGSGSSTYACTHRRAAWRGGRGRVGAPDRCFGPKAMQGPRAGLFAARRGGYLTSSY